MDYFQLRVLFKETYKIKTKEIENSREIYDNIFIIIGKTKGVKYYCDSDVKLDKRSVYSIKQLEER